MEDAGGCVQSGDLHNAVLVPGSESKFRVTGWLEPEARNPELGTRTIQLIGWLIGLVVGRASPMGRSPFPQSGCPKPLALTPPLMS
jgi:hypothetical protein